ncbi:MAG: hypothetical protein JWN32_2955 [Solirubrobacterales bacterium]|jgi:hypothetical protein|nr:hypothetical protein [Solirubrobacterales bacterium]
MYLSRKSLFSVTLAVALFGTPAAAAVHAPGVPGVVSQPPVVQFATLPRRVRPRRRVRRAKVRVIAWWARPRMRGAAERVRSGRASVQPRLPPHESFARGPPRPSGR